MLKRELVCNRASWFIVFESDFSSHLFEIVLKIWFQFFFWFIVLLKRFFECFMTNIKWRWWIHYVKHEKCDELMQLCFTMAQFSLVRKVLRADIFEKSNLEKYESRIFQYTQTHESIYSITCVFVREKAITLCLFRSFFSSAQRNSIKIPKTKLQVINFKMGMHFIFISINNWLFVKRIFNIIVRICEYKRIIFNLMP